MSLFETSLYRAPLLYLFESCKYTAFDNKQSSNLLAPQYFHAIIDGDTLNQLWRNREYSNEAIKNAHDEAWICEYIAKEFTACFDEKIYVSFPKKDKPVKRQKYILAYAAVSEPDKKALLEAECGTPIYKTVPTKVNKYLSNDIKKICAEKEPFVLFFNLFDADYFDSEKHSFLKLRIPKKEMKYFLAFGSKPLGYVFYLKKEYYMEDYGNTVYCQLDTPVEGKAFATKKLLKSKLSICNDLVLREHEDTDEYFLENYLSLNKTYLYRAEIRGLDKSFALFNNYAASYYLCLNDCLISQDNADSHWFGTRVLKRGEQHFRTKDDAVEYITKRFKSFEECFSSETPPIYRKLFGNSWDKEDERYFKLCGYEVI